MKPIMLTHLYCDIYFHLSLIITALNLLSFLFIFRLVPSRKAPIRFSRFISSYIGRVYQTWKNLNQVIIARSSNWFLAERFVESSMKCSRMNSRYCVLSRTIDAHWTDSREEPRDGERKQRVAWCTPGPGEGGPAATRYRNSLVAPFTDYSWRSVSRERRRASERLWATAAERIGLGKGASTGATGPHDDDEAALARLGSTRLSGEKIRDLAQLRHAGPPLVGWLAGLAWRTESPPGHPPRPFTGTEPHPIPVTLIHPCTDSRPRLRAREGWEGEEEGI